MSTDINITLKAIDRASATIKDVASKTEASMGQVKDANKKVEASSKDVALAFNNVATSGFALYNAVDRVMDMQVQVDRANLAVKTSLNAVEDAQTRYNATVEKYGPASEQAQAAAKDLQLAQERYQVATERASMIQGNLNEAMFQSALTVIPSLITMITSVSTLTKGWTAVTQGISGAMSFLGANPIVLVIMGIAALVAGLIWAYQNCEPFRNAINAIAGALGAFFGPAIEAIKNALVWVWNNVLVPLGQFIVSTFVVAWQGLTSVWTNGILPAINTVRGALEWFYTNVLVPLGNFIGGTLVAAWNAFGNAVTWVYNTLIKPIFDALSWFYENVIKPIAGFLGGLGGGTPGLSPGGSGGPKSGQHGGLISSPTLLWAGEAGPEALVPLSARELQRLGLGMGSPTVSIVVQGSMDQRVADYVIDRLRSVLVESSSSGAGSTHKRIRV